MKPEIKRQWVEALRSGNYRQGHSVLHRVSAGDETFCCLGVLCELARQAGIVTMDDTGRTVDDKTGGKAMVYRNIDPEISDNSTIVLPRIILSWSGLDDTNPTLMYDADHYVISDLNDGVVIPHKLSFDELADIIEAQL